MQREITEGFVRRSLIASVIIALLAAVFTAVYARNGVVYAGIYLIFVAWAVTNLLIWSASVREVLGPRRPIFVAPLFALKFLWIALLLALCYLVSIKEWGRFSSFLLGSLTPFIVMLLKALGLALTRGAKSDRTKKLLEKCRRLSKIGHRSRT